MSKNSNFKEENNNSDSGDFYDILSIPSNPEDFFTLQYPIGHGAFGSVYKAVHNSSNKLYAIKIIDFSKGNNKENNNIINYNYFSVQQETSLMKLVNQSNYIVKYYGSYFSRKSNTLWLILEYCCSGSTIDLMLSMNRTFSEVEVATIMEMVLQGLILIHSKNLIHRDIKGANILLSEDGYAKLADFGVGAQILNEKYRKSKKGSPYWMSPQVASNLNYDFKTDIWSLGITCVELLEGEPPFSKLKPKNVMEKIAKKPPRVDEIIDLNEHTYEFKSFIEHCLEIDPKKRYTAEELLKHEFITKFTKGRKYLINLIKKHEIDVEKFRFENEEEYQKILKNNEKNLKFGSLNNEESEEEEMLIEKNICKGTYQENINEDNFESFDNKILKFFKKDKIEIDKNNVKNNNIDNNFDKNTDIDKNESIKSFEKYYNESIIASDDKNLIYNDKDNLIVLDKNIKKNINKKNIISSSLEIIKNGDFGIYSQKNINNIKECNNDEKNILKLSTSCQDITNNSNPTEYSSKRGNEEKNGSNKNSSYREKKKKHSPKDSCDTILNTNEEELKTSRNRKPLEFEKNSNDITYLNNKENEIKEENINDADDEGITHEINDYKNFFKGVEIYQNKSGNPYSEPNFCEYTKNFEVKKSF